MLKIQFDFFANACQIMSSDEVGNKIDKLNVGLRVCA